MQNVILVIHILACLAMIGLVLLQKSEGGGLGIGGGGNNSLMSGRGAAGAMVRATMLFGAIFFVTSLTLTSIANRSADDRSSIERALETGTPSDLDMSIDLIDPSAALRSPSPSFVPAQPAEPAPSLPEPAEEPAATDETQAPEIPQ